jgi:uncharacterized protein (TIGR00369 family)
MTDFDPRDPGYAENVRRVFGEAPFIRTLGAELVELAPGLCTSALGLRDDLLQQDGLVHAGVQATLADHTAGCAAATLMATDQRVLTAEFKINLLRAARGDRLVCRAHVLRPGRTLTIAESEVFTLDGAAEALTAKAMVTLALVE